MKHQPTTEEKKVWFYQALGLTFLAGLIVMMWGVPYNAHAEMFPSDAITETYDTLPATPFANYASTTKTILYISATTDGDSVNDSIELWCGGNFIHRMLWVGNYDHVQEPLQVVCNGDFYGTWESDTGTYAMITLTYVDRDITAMKGFDYGSLLSNMWLLLIFAVLFFAEVRAYITKRHIDVTLKKEYIK